MTDLYIATPTQGDHNALIRLAEVAGYHWWTGSKATKHDYDWTNYYDNKGGEVIYLDTKKRELTRASRHHYEREGHTIETIPNLADIKAVWHITKGNHSDFVTVYPKAKHMLIIENGLVIQNEDGSFDYYDSPKYKVLAVEYKPQESEVMTEKVKFSKEVYRGLKAYGLPENGGEVWPMGEIKNLYVFWENYASSVLGTFIDSGDNQWKLIDALRYGYETEQEQLYYVLMPVDSKWQYLAQDKDRGFTCFERINRYANEKYKFTMSEIIAIDPRYKDFAVRVEEVDGNE